MSRSPSESEPDAPPAVTTFNAAGGAPLVLTCDHASNHIPPDYDGLGLPAAELARHIAWDIGAADLARALSDGLDATLFLSGYSRLLIDCNRPPGSLTSIVARSEATDIPGNRDVPEAERQHRLRTYFTPYRDAIAAHLDRRAETGRPTLLVGIHSFTPVFHGEARQWQAGVLYRDATAFAHALLAELRRDPTLTIGDNEPYRVTPQTDYTVPVHGDARGIPALLIEVRQDLIASPEGVAEWAGRLAPALGAVAEGMKGSVELG